MFDLDMQDLIAVAVIHGRKVSICRFRVGSHMGGKVGLRTDPLQIRIPYLNVRLLVQSARNTRVSAV